MSFLGEIKRRKVFQVAVVYAVVAWLTIQIVDVVGEPLSLPDWFDTVVIVLFAVGFPIAVILAWAFDITSQGITVDSGPGSATPVPQTSSNKGTILIQAFVLIAVVVLLVTDRFVLDRTDLFGESEPRPTSSLVERSEIPIEVIAGTAGGQYVTLAISADRRNIAYSAYLEGTGDWQLYLRPLSSLEAHPLPGLDQPMDPMFTADGESIVYSDNDGIWRVNIGGGRPEPLTPRMTLNPGLWVTGNEVIFVSQSDDGSVIHKIAMSDGAENQVQLSTVEPAEASWPSSLPNERHILVTLVPPGAAARQDGRIALLDTETGDLTDLIYGYNARYVDSGHLLFMRLNDLWAVPFDWPTLETRGSEARVLAALTTRDDGGAAYSVTDDGLLVYAPNRPFTDFQRESNLVWIDRNGSEEPLNLEPDLYGQLHISPDGEQLAYIVGLGGERDIWIHNFASGATRKRTTSAEVRELIWSPDSSEVVYTSLNRRTWRVTALGIDQPRPVDLQISIYQGLISALSGQDLLYLAEIDGETQLRRLTVNGSELLDEIVTTAEEDEIFIWPRLSPDARWIAYLSGNAETADIFLRPFPNSDLGRSQITYDGAASPVVWGTEGRELLYRDSFGGNNIMRVAIDESSGVPVGSPQPAILGNPAVHFGPPNTHPQFAVHPFDGRILVTRPIDSSSIGTIASRSLIVVNNWFEELERLAPADE